MIEILDKDFKKIDILRTYTYASYTEELRGLGKFQANVPITDEYLYLLDKTQQRYFLFDNEILGVIEKVVRSTDSEYSDNIVITGRLSNVLLTRRVIDRTINVSIYASKYINSLLKNFYGTGAKYVEQKVNYTYIGYPEALDTGYWNKYKVKKQVTGGYVWDEIKEVLDDNKIGINVRPEVVTKQIVDEVETNVLAWNIKLIDGYDRTNSGTIGRTRGSVVILSQKLSNLSDGTYSRDVSNLKSVAIVAGEGEGVDRKYLRTTINEAVPENKLKTGFALNELWIDARDLQKEKSDGTSLTDEEYINVLIDRANTKAEENTLNESYESTITQRGDLYQYGKDYDLGDWVTVEDKDLQVTVDAQIISVTKTWQNSSAESIVDIGFSYGKVEQNPVEKVNNNIVVTQGQQVSIDYLENKTDKTNNEMWHVSNWFTTEKFSASAGIAYWKTISITLPIEPKRVVFVPTVFAWCTVENWLSTISGKTVSIQLHLDVVVKTSVAQCGGYLLYQ